MSKSVFEIDVVKSPDDLEATFRLEKDAFGPFGTDDPPEIIELRQKTYPGGFIVARLNGEVVGYSSSEKWDDLRSPRMGEDPTKTHSTKGTVFCITTMLVREDQRERGIGTAMLDYLMNLAAQQGCHTIIVETPRTRSFYEEHGFQLLRTEKDRGVEVAILAKQLDAN